MQGMRNFQANISRWFGCLTEFSEIKSGNKKPMMNMYTFLLHYFQLGSQDRVTFPMGHRQQGVLPFDKNF
jgi:hypothetical protein